jgi:hypothetical protein
LPNKGRQLKIYFKFRSFRASKIWPKAILPRAPVGLMELDKRAAFGQARGMEPHSDFAAQGGCAATPAQEPQKNSWCSSWPTIVLHLTDSPNALPAS